MSTNDLASDDLRRLRNEAAKNAMLARRGDLYEITRAEILQANGIDPNKVVSSHVASAKALKRLTMLCRREVLMNR